jgi:glycosyltransferase involved in cell wall biosynthesis
MIERYLAKRTTAIVAISDRQKRELAHHYKLCEPSKIHVIPLGFDLSKFRENQVEKRKEFREKYLLDEDEIAVGIIGRLVPVKNHSLFMGAAANVLKETKRRVRFFIIGDGESRLALFKEAAVLGLDFTYTPDEKRKSSLTFTSWIRDVDVCIAGLDIVALCSFNEGTPVSLIEAQAGDRPVISTNVGGIENVVKNGETALLVDSNDYKAFTEKLLLLVEDDELRKRMSEKSWDFVREKFHFTRLIKEMSTLYKNMLSKKRN